MGATVDGDRPVIGDGEVLLTAAEFGRRIRRHPQTIRKMAARGEIPGAAKIGKGDRGRAEWRFPVSSIAATLRWVQVQP
jgi:helix-turn-helix protein